MTTSKPIFYISVDVETDGWVPSMHSMLSIGAAAFNQDLEMVDTFSINLQPRGWAEQLEDTMEWWKKFPEAYEVATEHPVDPYIGMRAFADWLKQFDGKLIAVGWPMAFDYMWLFDYFIRYMGESPLFKHSIDIKTLASVYMKVPVHQVTREYLPKAWAKEYPEHNHEAETDAIEQGIIFTKLWKELQPWALFKEAA